MGLRQNILKALIHKTFGATNHDRPLSREIEQSKHHTKIVKMYRDLGGTLESPPLRFGSWDICATRFIVELDEERHFNRYRLVTLKNSYYVSRPVYFSVNEYISYCQTKEKQCLKAASWSRNWKNSSTEKQFIASQNEGHLDRNGSSRWRQRAYYDFLKDVVTEIMGVPLIRLSIYDKFGSKTLGHYLSSDQKKTQSAKNIAELLNTRLHKTTCNF